MTGGSTTAVYGLYVAVRKEFCACMDIFRNLFQARVKLVQCPLIVIEPHIRSIFCKSWKNLVQKCTVASSWGHHCSSILWPQTWFNKKKTGVLPILSINDKKSGCPAETVSLRFFWNEGEGEGVFDTMITNSFVCNATWYEYGRSPKGKWGEHTTAEKLQPTCQVPLL